MRLTLQSKASKRCVLQAQRPSLQGLPDVILHKIMCIVWDARSASEASSEVQLALSLLCLSRRFQRVLRAHPLQLRLDFSNTQLAERHLTWLALPAWTDHVTSLTLYSWLAPACEGHNRDLLDTGLCAENDVVSPLLTVLHANQHASLRQLLGMPLRLGGVHAEPPPASPDDMLSMSIDLISDLEQYIRHVDLSAFNLTHLGVLGGFGDDIDFNELPQTLVSLAYRAAVREPHVRFSQLCGGGLADVSVFGGPPVIDLTCCRALDGWHAEVEGYRVLIFVCSAGHFFPHGPSSTLIGMREVRIDARYITICYMSCAGEENLGFEVFLDLLCPPCLVGMEIISGRDFPSIDLHRARIPGAWRLIMRQMMYAHGSRFAFEIDDGRQKRAAWRRWPAPGTQEHDTARRLHEAAWTWAAA